MSTTTTAVGGYGGHCCICTRVCMHTTPPSYCWQHTPTKPEGGSTTGVTIVGLEPEYTGHIKDCGSRCACYWRGRRDEIKES